MKKSYKNLLRDEKLVLADIGAMGGIHPRFKVLGKNLKMLLFEPENENFKNLQKKYNNRALFNVALDKTKGTVLLNVTRSTGISSLYSPNLEFLRRFPLVERFDIIKTQQLNVNTLDSVVSDTEIDHIKIDTQGSELRILKGAKKSLKKVWGLEIEVEFNSIYQDQPLFFAIDKFVKDNGFELFDIQRYHWCRNALPQISRTYGQIIFGNALYFKSTKQIFAILNNIEDQDKRKTKFNKLLALLIIYKRKDYALELLNMIKENQLIIYSDSEFREIEKICKKRITPTIPNFRGKGRIYQLFCSIASILKPSQWYDADREL